MPLTGLSPSAMHAAPLNSALISLDGPLKNYVVTNKTYKRVEDVVDALKKEFEANNFIVKGIRVTIDKEIKFSLVSFNRKFKKKSFLDKSYVFEIKADINTNLSFLLNNFNFPRSRFSKYERAVEALIEWKFLKIILI